MVEYLTKTDIIFINKKTIKRHGGNFMPPNNFLNEAPLDYLIDIVNSEIFGEPLYPSLSDKAGLYLFNIISNHVFSDGNKRTGLGAALLFLQLNGYQLQDDLVSLFSIKGNDETISTQPKSSNQILLKFVLEVAKAEVSLEKCQEWFEQNIIKQ
jgi:death-on-curing protein